MAIYRGDLLVKIVEARNLQNKDTFLKQSVFVELKIEGVAQKTKVIKRGGTRPVFNETLSLPIVDNRRSLEISAFDEDFFKNELIGETTLDLTDIISGKTGKNEFDGWLQLKDRRKATSAGEIYLEVTFMPKLKKPDAVPPASAPAAPLHSSPSPSPRPPPHHRISLDGGAPYMHHPSASAPGRHSLPPPPHQAPTPLQPSHAAAPYHVEASNYTSVAPGISPHPLQPEGSFNAPSNAYQSATARPLPSTPQHQQQQQQQAGLPGAYPNGPISQGPAPSYPPLYPPVANNGPVNPYGGGFNAPLFPGQPIHTPMAGNALGHGYPGNVATYPTAAHVPGNAHYSPTYPPAGHNTGYPPSYPPQAGQNAGYPTLYTPSAGHLSGAPYPSYPQGYPPTGPSFPMPGNAGYPPMPVYPATGGPQRPAYDSGSPMYPKFPAGQPGQQHSGFATPPPPLPPRREGGSRNGDGM